MFFCCQIFVDSTYSISKGDPIPVFIKIVPIANQSFICIKITDLIFQDKFFIHYQVSLDFPWELCQNLYRNLALLLWNRFVYLCLWWKKQTQITYLISSTTNNQQLFYVGIQVSKWIDEVFYWSQKILFVQQKSFVDFMRYTVHAPQLCAVIYSRNKS